jgi:hypothetical protein
MERSLSSREDSYRFPVYKKVASASVAAGGSNGPGKETPGEMTGNGSITSMPSPDQQGNKPGDFFVPVERQPL